MISDNEIAVPAFTIHRRDRNRHGGGVDVYVSDTIICSAIKSCSFLFGLECIWVSLSSSSLPSNVVFGCFYRPPQSGPSLCVYQYLKTCYCACKRFVIACGDFNVDISDAHKPYTSTFLQLLSSNDLIHHISESTYPHI